MGSEHRGDITRLAQRWSEGEADAFGELIELVYDDLRSLAQAHLRREGDGGTIDTTALVHEAWMKLAQVDEGSWQGRAHFFAFCSKAMRRILIDHARGRRATKRGGGQIRIPLHDNVAASTDDVADLIALDDALTRLEARNQRMASIVECRFFGGMSVAETAEALASSPRTVERDWARARAYLYEELSQ